MTFEMIVVLLILIAAVVLFATEKLPVDLVSFMIMASLLVTGVITAEEGIAGFSNMATVTVAAMFVLSAGLFKTGAVNAVGRVLNAVGKRNFWLALFAIMIPIGAISAFINNTAAVAIFLPIVLGLAREMKVSPSKLLMPLSFASMFGGVCTLIGTSTNILVSSIAERRGQPAFGMFEFAPLGLVMFGVGLIYMVLIGVRLIPKRREPGDLTASFGMGDYLTEVILLPEAESVGKPLRDSPLVRDLDIDVIDIFRGAGHVRLPGPDAVLEANDLLRVRSNVEKIRQLEQQVGIVLKSGIKWRDEDLQSAEAVLVEAVIAPNSRLEGQSLKGTNFRNTFGATALAIRHRGETMHERLGNAALRAGDVLLIEVARDRLKNLKDNPAFVIVSEVGLPEFRTHKVIPALAIVFAVVVVATLNIMPIVATAIIGSVMLVLAGCITLEEAYNSIDWKIIFLLAGVLSLGIALEKTGTAELLSSAMVRTVGAWGPAAVASSFYLLASLLTASMSNNATAALLAPIAIATAIDLNVDARPLLMAVTFAASASFITPVGYQTNMLIYGPGQYKFADFFRVGAPLNLVFWLLATWLIPRFWPF